MKQKLSNKRWNVDRNAAKLVFYITRCNDCRRNGKHPIVRYRVSDDEFYTFQFAERKSRQSCRQYYICHQCDNIRQKSSGFVAAKMVHVEGEFIVNGNPTIGHADGCQPLRISVYSDVSQVWSCFIFCRPLLHYYVLQQSIQITDLSTECD